MNSFIETSLKAFSDGFGGMAITDVGDTEEGVVNALTEDSPWEVIDGIEKLPKCHYLVKLNCWWEDNFPEPDSCFITEVVGHEKIEP